MKTSHYRSLATIILALSSAPLFAASISGSAFYRERIALPPGAVFEATLQDVSKAGGLAKTIATTSYISAGTMPFQFTIDYDDKLIAPKNQYSVRASIRVADKLMFTSDTHIDALNAKQPLSIRLINVASQTAETNTPPSPPLRNTYWKLTALNGQAVVTAEHQREPHIIFSADEARLSGSGGCNGIMGGFTLEGDHIKFTQMAGTMMACQHGMEQESMFLRSLPTVSSYKIVGDALELFNDDNTLVARFIAVNKS
jgi:putative lipoprotein